MSDILTDAELAELSSLLETRSRKGAVALRYIYLSSPERLLATIDADRVEIARLREAHDRVYAAMMDKEAALQRLDEWHDRMGPYLHDVRENGECGHNGSPEESCLGCGFLRILDGEVSEPDACHEEGK